MPASVRRTHCRIPAAFQVSSVPLNGSGPFYERERPMNDADVAKFDAYWRTITGNEDFIRQHGHNGCPDWQDKWHHDLEDAYSQVRPLLASATTRQMYRGLPGGLNPIEAENYHHALVLVLNPPEQWFGNLGMLSSPEYLALKRRTEEEEERLHAHPVAAVEEARANPFDELSDTAMEILQAMDDKEPQRWKEIARRADYSEDKVRQYSTELQNKNCIKKTRRGFIRTVSLPDKCEKP